MMNSYLITLYSIQTNKTGTASFQNSILRYKRYATVMQKNPELFNDFSNTALQPSKFTSAVSNSEGFAEANSVFTVITSAKILPR